MLEKEEENRGICSDVSHVTVCFHQPPAIFREMLASVMLRSCTKALLVNHYCAAPPIHSQSYNDASTVLMVLPLFYYSNDRLRRFLHYQQEKHSMVL